MRSRGGLRRCGPRAPPRGAPVRRRGWSSHPQGGVRAALENDGGGRHSGRSYPQTGSRSIPAKSNSLTDRGKSVAVALINRSSGSEEKLTANSPVSSTLRRESLRVCPSCPHARCARRSRAEPEGLARVTEDREDEGHTRQYGWCPAARPAAAPPAAAAAPPPRPRPRRSATPRQRRHKPKAPRRRRPSRRRSGGAGGRFQGRDLERTPRCR